VPYTLPGEIVEVDPWLGHPDRRNLLRVETASPRHHADLSAFRRSGGCALQHWDAAPYRAWKRDAVVAQLHRVDISASVADSSMPMGRAAAARIPRAARTQ